MYVINKKKYERRDTLMCIVLAILLCTLTVFSITCRKRPSSISQKVIVAQWGQEKYLIYLPLYVALEKGYFSNEGLDVNIRFSGNDDQVFASVLQGGANFGVGDPVFTAIANERKENLGRVVASIVNGVAIWGVTNREDMSVITSKKDLAGLRVGTFPSPSTNYALMRETIVSGGDDLESTKIVEAPIGGQIALLEKRAADIAMVLEPAASKAEAQGYRVVFSSPKFYGPFAFTGLTASVPFIHKHPETVQAMVNGLQLALRYCHNDPNGATVIAQRLFPSLDAKVVEKAVRRMLAEKTVPTTVLVTEESWQAALSTRIAVGDLRRPQEYSKSVDASFAKKAIANYP